MSSVSKFTKISSPHTRKYVNKVYACWMLSSISKGAAICKNFIALNRKTTVSGKSVLYFTSARAHVRWKRNILKSRATSSTCVFVYGIRVKYTSCSFSFLSKQSARNYKGVGRVGVKGKCLFWFSG